VPQGSARKTSRSVWSHHLTAVEHGLHPVGGLAVRDRQDVAVRVHGEADLAVARRFHYNSRMHALDKQQRGACVSQVVEAHRRQDGLHQQPVKPMCDVRSVGERAPIAREDQVQVDPAITCRKTLRAWPRPWGGEPGHGESDLARS
jgi:hypothetical protein